MIQDLFLIILGIIYLAFASASDLRKREIPNWLCFSLIIFAVVYRCIFALLYSDLNYFLFGILGLGIFVFLGYLFYYMRVFAGGDAKLLMGLGLLLPLSSALGKNLFLFILFIFLLFLLGSIWGLGFSLFNVLVNFRIFREEFARQLKLNKKFVSYVLAFSVVLFLFMAIYNSSFTGIEIVYIVPLLILSFPILYVYAKAIEEACFVVDVSPKDLTIGDWLYKKVKIGKRFIKPNWEGLDEKELEILRKNGKKVKVKYGVPFGPSFLFAFVVFLTLYFWYYDLISFLRTMLGFG